MLNLGIVNQETKTNTCLDNLLEVENCCVSTVDNKEQLQQLDGLVIIMKAKDQLTSVIEWLIASQAIPEVFVWIYSEVLLESEQMIMMNLGANDVVESPENLPHLSIIIKNTFSRIKSRNPEIITYSSEKFLNEENQTAYINGKELPLTKKEYNLLQVLYENQNKTVQYEELMDKVWKNHSKENTFVIANTIFHLRNKIKESNAVEIKTTRSKGYILKTKNY